MKKIIVAILAIPIIVVIYMAIVNGISPKLGVVDGKLRELESSPNGVSTQTMYDEKKVEPFVANSQSMKIILDIVLEMRGLIVTSEDDYLHVIFSTSKGFRDDVEFYIDGGFVHYRSQSRVGYSDMNKNYERYLIIKEKYEKASK